MFNIITFLLVILISFSIWNLITLYALKKNNRSQVPITDDHYYELKYKMEYITTIVIVVLSVGGYFGYQWFGSIKEDTAKDLSKKTEIFERKFDSITFQLKAADYKINSYNSKFSPFNSAALEIGDKQKNILEKQNKLSNNINSSNQNLRDVTTKINDIKSKNILKQNFYIIDNLTYNLAKDDSKIFYFHDYLTTSGDKVPSFTKIPFVSVSSGDGVGFSVIKITTEYVQITVNSYQENVIEAKVSLLLSEQ